MARSLDLRLPMVLGSCVLGLLTLKLMFSNLGSILCVLWGLFDSAFSFVFGSAIGPLIGGLFQHCVVLAIVWIAFRKILGANSIPIRGAEQLFGLALRQVPALVRWTLRAMYPVVFGRQTKPTQTERGGRD